MRRSSRLALSCASLLTFAVGLLAASADAVAQPLGGGDLEIELELPDEDGDFGPRDETTVLEYFNLASCVCPDVPFGVRLSLVDVPASLPTNRIELWVGTRCDDPDPRIRDENCENVGTIPDVEDLRSPERREIPVAALIATQSDVCELRQATRSFYAIIDPADDGVGEGDFVKKLDIFVDTEPPPEPSDIEATGAEQSIVVSWDAPSSRADDVRYYQLLCARADGSPVGDSTDLDPRYQTSLLACGIDDGTEPFPPTGRVSWAGGGDGGVLDGGVSDAGPGDDDAGPGADAGTSEPLPDGLRDLDPAFLCGEAGGTDTQLRASNLENGVSYRIVLAVIDPSRNVTAIDLGEHTPSPVVDGWEHYKDAGGSADGGYCFIATASFGDYDHPSVVVLRDFRDGTLAKFGLGRAFIDWYYATSPPLAAYLAEHRGAAAITRALLMPLVVVAGFWEYTGALGKLGALLALSLLIVLRRRRRRARSATQPTRRRSSRRARLAAGAAAVALALVAFDAVATAQPYWDEYNEPVQSKIGAAPVHWNFEIKVGPYVPAVDSEFDLGADEIGPFEQMYGDGPFVMPQLTLDRYLLYPAGQLGISASIGYLSRGAKAFQVDEMGNVRVDDEGLPMRAEGDSSTFRMLPTSLSLVYRLTVLDDRFRVPIVPYGRLGLAYHLWWISSPDGSVAEVPNMDCPDAGQPDADCDGDRARGGTLGWQGSIGIAVRAERLDPDAEVSLRNELGIEHAGFFAELAYAKVDGFGAEDKLRLGDFTWFAGINFEF